MGDRVTRGLWNVVLSGYPRSGKTTLARKLINEYQNISRVSVDELRAMLFNEAPPCRDEYLVYSILAEMRDFLIRRSYSVVIDATAPDNVTRDFLLTTPIRGINQLLVILDVDREILLRRSIERCGDESLVLAWDKRWEESRKDCCLFKFKSNTIDEFEDYYARLSELLESEVHPYKPEFRPALFSLNEIREALRRFLERHTRTIISHTRRTHSARPEP